MFKRNDGLFRKRSEIWGRVEDWASGFAHVEDRIAGPEIQLSFGPQYLKYRVSQLMEATYKIIGGDGREYGPVSLSQLQGWAREGRINSQTQVRRSDQDGWFPAERFAELGLAPAPVTARTAGIPNALEAMAALERQVRSGADWFFWIAALSVINSIIALSGSQAGFVVGLGVTQVIDAVALSSELDLGAAGKAVCLVLDVLAAGLFALFGAFARKRHGWAFVVGMGLYALDGLLLALFQNWLSVGFHVFALYCIFSGLRAHRGLKALDGGAAARAG
jgi:hypothetical protein